MVVSVSSPPRPSTRDRVDRLAAAHARLRGQSTDDELAVRVGEPDLVGGGRALRHDRVGCAVAAADRGVEVDVDALQPGPREVASDEDGVRASECSDRERLDAVQVHRDRGDVTREEHTRAVAAHLHDLARVRAVEGEAVAAALPLDGVASVTGIPLERVVAGPEQRGVVAAVAVDEVLAGAPDQRVGTVAAEQRVVAVAAVDRDGLVGERAAGLVDADLVVAAAGRHMDRGEGRAVEGEVRCPVVADVDLQCVRVAHRQPQREPVVRVVTDDVQGPVLDARRVGGERRSCAWPEHRRRDCRGQRAQDERLLATHSLLLSKWVERNAACACGGDLPFRQLVHRARR